ncbi:MAG: hypothetical protein ACTHOH_09765 [Lysobacteraceae bacterium]
MRAVPVPRILLAGLIALLVADVALATAFLFNQLVGIDDAWAWVLGVVVVSVAFRQIRGWARAVVEGRLEALDARFPGEKIP